MRQRPVSCHRGFFGLGGSFGYCLLAVAAWSGLVIAASHAGLWTLVALTVFSAIAFLVGALFSALPHAPRLMARADAAAAGAMFTSALVLVVPHALHEHVGTGALGLAIGLATGLALHVAGSGGRGHVILGALSLHSICDGVVLGALYTLIPALGWGVGLAILAHKTPAGYILARRLADRPGQQMLAALPALATGIGALGVALAPRAVALPAGLIFGAAAGLFLFVALDFVISSAKVGSRDAVDWLVFGLGGTAVALTGWIAPHGI